MLIYTERLLNLHYIEFSTRDTHVRSIYNNISRNKIVIQKTYISKI